MTTHIQVKSIPPRIQYITDGVQTTFEFPFVIFNEDNIKVYFNETEQNANTYTVTYDNDGGFVTFTSAPAANITLTIVRDLAIERTTDFQEGGALRANVLNDELDYQIACQQQIADELNRSMVLPPYATDGAVDLTLPLPNAGKAIVWNADGTNLENSTIEINALESTLKDYRDVAEAEAAVACEKADMAVTAAQEATSKATEVTAAIEGFNHAHSNCVTSIPQDIKLELNNGVLKLKAGSIITFPDGSQYTRIGDSTLSISSSYNGKYVVSYALNYANVSICNLQTYSGLEPANPTSADLWYDTINNKIYRRWGSSWQDGKFSFPVCIISVANGEVNSIDEEFNGSGYIGSHFFVLPGVKGSCADGKNSDGTLKSKLVTQDQLRIYGVSGTHENFFGVMASTGGIGAGAYFISETKNSSGRTYVPSENIVYQSNGIPQASFPVCRFSCNDGKITKFETIQPFHALDCKDLCLMNNEFRGINTVPTPVAGNNSKQIANTEWVNANAGFGSTPRDVTVLYDGNGAHIQSSTNIVLSESWKNFDEVVVVGTYTNSSRSFAFRISTYWLDKMFQENSSVVIFSNGVTTYLSANGYNETNPSSGTNFYISDYGLAYLWKIYGVNRKST